MERLTKRDERYIEGDSRFLSPYLPGDVGFRAEVERLTRLGEFEDLMEKYNIEDLNQLEAIIINH